MYLSFTRDVIGPITRTVRDSAMILEIIGGIDPRDAGSSNNPVPGYSSLLAEGVKGKRFGVPRKYFSKCYIRIPKPSSKGPSRR